MCEVEVGAAHPSMHACVRCLLGPEGGIRSPGAGVTAPEAGAGSRALVLWEDERHSELLSHLSSLMQLLKKRRIVNSATHLVLKERYASYCYHNSIDRAQWLLMSIYF